MRTGNVSVLILSLAILLPSVLRAQEVPPGRLMPAPEVQPDAIGPDFFLVQKTQPEPTPKDKKDSAPPPMEDLFASAPPPTASAPQGINNHMIGDFLGRSTLKVVTLPVTQQFTTFIKVVDQDPMSEGPRTKLIPVSTQVQGTATNLVRVPVASQGAFKIGENESPIPQDRVFFTLNYFNDARGLGANVATPRTETTTILVDGRPVRGTFFNPGFAPVTTSVQRQVFGFEKTFLDGNASFECRLPFFQQYGVGALNESGMGDMTMVLRYAPYYDRVANNAFSVGLAVTIPTGEGINTVVGNVHPTLFQPFVGGLWHFGDLFVQGFSSVVLPTDDRDLTLAFNDIGVGYWIYRGEAGSFLRSIVPTAELHITTPLETSTPESLFYVPDIFVVTGGVHFGLGNRSVLTFGVAVPVSGPRPFDTEAVVQFNCRF